MIINIDIIGASNETIFIQLERVGQGNHYKHGIYV
jgi:hypothetical protein